MNAPIMADKNVTATFTATSYAVTFQTDGTAGSSLTGTTPQTINYQGNATAVTAHEPTGYHFVNWTGTGGFVTSTANPLTVTNVTADMTITANYAINTYTVTTTATNGSITSAVNPVVNHGSTTTVTGTANTGYYFTGVNGCGGTAQTNTSQSVTAFSYTTGPITADCAVGAVAQAVFVLNASSPLTYNTSETLSTTGGSGTGLVTYQVTAGSCTITGAQLNQLTANSGTGSCTVTAIKAADNNYSAVTAVPVIVALQQALPVITFDSVPSPTFPGPDFTLSATTTNTDSSALSFRVESGPCSLVSGSTFRPTGAGICVIQAVSEATGNFGGAFQTLSITITAATAAPAVVPTMNEWGMILFMLLAGVGSIYHIRRNRGV